MSHGGRENEAVPDKPVSRLKRKSGDEFACGVAKIAVAQICESAGFQSFQQSALEKLSDVTVRYIGSLGKMARLCSNLAGRSEGNVFDIIQGLEELGFAQGFANSSDVNHCLATSGVVRDIVNYVIDAEDIPFAYSIPSFPISNEKKPDPSFLDIGEEPPAEHIPAWLPAFPDPQTYLQLPPGNEGGDVLPSAERVEPAKLHITDSSFLNLRPQFIGNGTERQHFHGDKGKEVALSNPFLTAPLQFGEKEVSQVAPPDKLSVVEVRKPVEHNRVVGAQVSVLEAFAPAIDSMKNSICDSEEGAKKGLLHQRTNVQFKIGVGKKSLGMALQMKPQYKGVELMGSWFAEDDEKNEKKRRAEKILKESMENPGELTQL